MQTRIYKKLYGEIFQLQQNTPIINTIYAKGSPSSHFLLSIVSRVRKFWSSDYSCCKLHVKDGWGHLEEHSGNAHCLNSSPLTLYPSCWETLEFVTHTRTHRGTSWISAHKTCQNTGQGLIKHRGNTGNWNKLTKEWRWACGNSWCRAGCPIRDKPKDHKQCQYKSIHSAHLPEHT